MPSNPPPNGPYRDPKTENSKPMHVRLSTVRVDVENAFLMLEMLLEESGSPHSGILIARARVMAFLDQCEADERQRKTMAALVKEVVKDYEDAADWKDARVRLQRMAEEALRG